MFSDENRNNEVDDEVVPESTTGDEVEIEDIESADEHKTNKVKKQLKACEAEKRAAQEELQRTKADFLNAKRRLEEARHQDQKRTEVAWIEKLLPLCDSFQMAMSNTEVWEAVDENWRRGIEGIHQQLQSLLQEHNVTSINPVGEPFDPNEHEAIGTEHDADAASDSVLKVVQSGYKQGDTVIRPAKVIITA